MAWYYNGSSIKSYANIDKLIHDVIKHEDFRASDFRDNFLTIHKAELMDKHQMTEAFTGFNNSNSEDLPFKLEDGWILGHVFIPLPVHLAMQNTSSIRLCILLQKFQVFLSR